MQKTIKALTLLLLALWPMVHTARAQAGQEKKFTISGYMRDSANGEALLGGGVYIEEAKKGAVANNYGFYSITLPAGTYTAVYSYVGYQRQVRQIDLDRNITISPELSDAAFATAEVVISADRQEREANVRSTQMSVQKLDIKQIKSLPPLFGEVDIVRAVQLLPGVTTVGEGASGFNVRGGAVDHNLILQDEAPVYNSSHLFGLFSVFNPDAVRDVKLYKGGIPAAYGGRLASLLDVRLKEGNSKKFEASGGIGTIMSRFAVEGPIVKDKISFVVAARRSYIDVLAKPFLAGTFKGSKFYFYDLSGKVNYKIDPKNTVFVSGYLGRDVFQFGKQFFSNWGNATGTARWNHVFNSKIFANATAIRSDFSYSLGSQDGVQQFKWDSNIKSWQGKYDLTHYVSPDLTLTYGGSAILYTVVPGKVKPLGDNSIFTNLELPNQRGLEYAAYGSGEYKIAGNVSIVAGLRVSAFDYRGNKDSLYKYNYGTDGQRGTIASVSGKYKGKYGSQAFYPNLEPRLAVNYGLGDGSSIKASYQRTAQYIHLISNTTAASPLDVWTPSTSNIKPQLADQVAIGYFRNFGAESDWETSAEVYYKDMQNQIDYVDGAELLLNPNLEGELLRGKGRAYGLELYIKKNTGKLTGFVSYTLSKTERNIPGINYDRWYPSKYDRPNNLSITGSYELRPRLSVSALFTFATGTPATFPTGRSEVGGIIYPIVDGRNQTRIPDYHRLDLSVTLKRPKRTHFQGEWVFGVYNAYARRNAFSIYAKQGDTFETRYTTEMRRIAVFGSFIPSVTYNFNII